MITDPVIRENSKGLEVPDFNKKEVENIAKGVCVNKFDLDNPTDGAVEVQYDSNITIDEALEQGILPSTGGDYDNVTDEQIAKLYALLKKACADGKVKCDDYVCFINYVYRTTISLKICFGCVAAEASNNHDNGGLHIEIDLDYENKTYQTHLREI